MQLEWNGIQRELRQEYSALGREIASLARDKSDRTQFNSWAWRELSKKGMWSLAVGREKGGMGFGWWEFAAAMEGLSTTVDDLGLLLSIIAHIGAVRVIAETGRGRYAAEMLAAMLEGKIGATAITEPTGGSDVARVCTTASPKGPTDEGVYWLNGVKQHITNAPIALHFIVAGRISGLPRGRDISLFIVDRNMPGLVTGPAEDMLGNASSPTGSIEFDNVEILDENVLGERGQGLRLLYNMISLDRLLYGLIASSFTEPLLEEAHAFAENRIAFGAPIADYQYVQEKIVSMKVNMERTRYLTYAALHHLITGHPEAVLMCSAAKLSGSEGLWETAQNLVQLHGHAGYMHGRIANVLVDALATLIAGGTSEIQKVNIFNQMSNARREHHEINS